MEAFDAVIMRDGTVHHLPWQTHTGIIAHWKIPENTSPVRQHYWEYDLRAPFSGGYNGLQPRGIEDPPEVVVRAAERLTEKLGNWHRGRDLETLPDEWGDLVEHVFGVLGDETPEFLNGRGGVFFTGVVEEMTEDALPRLIGAATVRRLSGDARIGAMWGRARVDAMSDDARIGCVYEAGSVGCMRDDAVIEILCQSAIADEMHDRSRVMIMHGASRVLALYDASVAARAADGVVYTPDRDADRRQLLAADKRWKRVEIVEPGAAVLA